MNKIFSSILLLFFLKALSAQSFKDSALLSVYYRYSHMIDTLHPNNSYQENMILSLGKESSVFQSQDKITQDSIYWQHASAQNISSGINLENRRPTTTAKIYKKYAENKLTVNQQLVNDYLITVDIKPIQWQIGKDTMTIGNFKCQKAVGRFRGRDYIAWFTPDIPIPAGPWKLSGLPGLILEAFDTKHQVFFSFSGYEPYGRNVVIALPPKGIKTTREEYNKINEATSRDPNALADLINSSGKFSGSVKIKSITYPPGFKKQVDNNPIELTDD